MQILGRVQDGVIVLPGGVKLPEGASVAVSFPANESFEQENVKSLSQHRRVQIPLVKTGRPGSVALTGDAVAAILDEEDVSAGR